MCMKRTRSAGYKLHELRVNAGLSPEQLGYRAGVSGMTIRRIERGGCKPTPQTMFRLASEFDLDVIDLWPIERRRVAVR